MLEDNLANAVQALQDALNKNPIAASLTKLKGVRHVVTYFSGAFKVLRVGRAPVTIRRFVRSYIRMLVHAYIRIPQLDRNQLERHSWTGTRCIARDRFSTDRVFLCV